MILAVDPGNVESAYVEIDRNLRPIEFGKLPNEDIRCVVRRWVSIERATATVNGRPTRPVYVEMISHYGTGMPAGQTVFDTCRVIGHLEEIARPVGSELIFRRDVKLHLCGLVKAKDSNVRQALIDRFGEKGTKSNPGWFYGFSKDVWQAYALAVYVADTAKSGEVAA